MLSFSPFNLLCIVLNLLILLVLMKKFLYKPVLGVIAKRQELMDQQFASAKASKEEAEQLKQQYETYMSEAVEEKNQIIKEAKAQAVIEYEKILEDAGEQSRQMIENAQIAGQREKEKAVQEAGDQIAQLAMAAASKIVSQSCDAKKDHDIYEEFLKKAGE